ncbi:conserved hypothetical protein [Histoplasma capsulatum H143]|uniref:Uncharacterized protein n=1 Tax=Ajellomyces capsulatus (strain H143) TaxID=544712 RepID=C6H3X0_AJECH|nr:conserved hypothetical protein [Histoplasma capsulatum H143]
MTERNSFDRAEKVGLLMASLFSLYLTYYSRDSFPFEWLQKTEDLEVCCRETSSEKVAFPMSPELLKAINKCGRVTAPGKCQKGLPGNWGFAGFMKTAAHQLGVGIMIDSYIRIKGVQIFQLRHNHWSCIVRDHSSAFDATQQGNSRDYLLRSELLAVTSIFFHQMNEMVWLPEEDWYMAKPIYKEEFLTATVVTFHLRESTHCPSNLQSIGNVPNTQLDAEGYMQPRQGQLRQEGSLQCSEMDFLSSGAGQGARNERKEPI